MSSIWITDEKVKEYYRIHGRSGDFRQLEPGEISYYDGLVRLDLSKVEPMIALPFHPSNAWPIRELNRHGLEILREVEAEGQKQLENPRLQFRLTDKLVNGRLKVDQGVVVGCAGGTFENIAVMAGMLDQKSVGNGDFSLSIYPASQPVYLELIRNHSLEKIMLAGAAVKTAFCGPCFGAGDTPANNALSIRHATRNFPNREGSKPSSGQLASVALMDARSIAATALHGGLLTPATEADIPTVSPEYHFSQQVYQNRVYQGFGSPNTREELKFGPDIADWPEMPPLANNLLLQMASIIHDPVTTTDELIPSGETSAYRSNPYKLAEYTLSRKDPGYVARAKAVRDLEAARREVANGCEPDAALLEVFRKIVEPGAGTEELRQLMEDTGLGSAIFAVKPGDGSAREQAASCQKVLGGQANIAIEYATKRYRSNLINWGMLPFTVSREVQSILKLGDCLFVPGIRLAVASGAEKVQAFVINDKSKTPVDLQLKNLSQGERDIILAGCLINYYAK